ncbi:MAG: DUF4831 family protein [Mangrovibacterium sp.]
MNTRVFIILALIFSNTIAVFGKKKEEAPILGLMYSLPRTVVKINVSAQCTQVVAGPYASFAESCLGIKNAPQHDVSLWHINSIDFKTFAEADPAQQYQSLGVAGSLVSLSNNGVIAGVNTIAPTQKENLSYSSFATPKMQIPTTNFSNLTMEGRTYTLTDSTGTHVFQKTDAEMAQEAANTIIDLRQQRFDLLASALDSRDKTDSQSLQAAAEKLTQMEEEYLALFIGISVTSAHNFSFDYVPTSQKNNGEAAFRFSESNGPVPASDLTGAPVTVSIEMPGTSTLEGMTATESENALYYRIPTRVNLVLDFAGKTLANAHLELAQFGTIMPIPNQLLDGRFEIIMNPETGAIMGSKQIIFETDNKKK